MRLGIDASNIRMGGGLTHLVEVLRAASPDQYGIKSVIVWGARHTLAQLPCFSWLQLKHEPQLDGLLPNRLIWQKTKLTQLAMRNCDMLLIPGGNYTGNFRPFITMSRNLLPFDPQERRRYGLAWTHLRLLLLESSQTSTFRRAAGVIFLTETARRVVEQRINTLPGKVTVISHGISQDFYHQPRCQKPLSAYSWKHPFRLLYVSIIDLYKHQWHIAEAVARLRQDGIPVALDLIGPAYQPALLQLKKAMQQIDPKGEFIYYLGPVSYKQLSSYYHRADGFAFASSCETFGQILLEGMASGLPIACSNRSAMPELLGDAGVYFDPEQPKNIAKALRSLIENTALRKRCAWAAYERAQLFSWERCARETFSFLAEVARSARKEGRFKPREIARL